MKYNWQQPDWPNFTYDDSLFDEAIELFAKNIGYVGGLLATLSEEHVSKLTLDIIVAEAIKTSEIEGEYINRQDVMSSIQNVLGLNEPQQRVTDVYATNIANLMLDVRDNYADKLSQTKLVAWHKMLFADISNRKKINIGKWRTHPEPMEVVSGHRPDKLTVHFQAPPSERVPHEMKQFISWFNQKPVDNIPIIKWTLIRAAISHIYFESIHPFDDGNGRIGRAIVEKAIAQGFKHPLLLSWSQTINQNKKAYYQALKDAQSSNDITAWIKWFIESMLAAENEVSKTIELTLAKTKLFDKYKVQLNERQLKAIKHVLKEGPEDFIGGLNAKKYIAITKASKATATRDLQHLFNIGLLKKIGGGRSTSYEINFD
jgi:Fic family protein